MAAEASNRAAGHRAAAATVLQPPSYEERLLIVGSNGSGKTFLTRRLLARYPRWVVVDHKAGFHPDLPAREYLVIRDPRDRRILTADRVVFRPAAEFKNRRWYEYLFLVLIRRAEAFARRGKRFIVLVDETLAFARMRATENLGNLAVLSREWGAGLWCSSQRLKWIPVEVKSEAWRIIAFYLADEEDEREVLKFAKIELSLEELRAHAHSRQFVELRRGAESGGRVQVRRFPRLRDHHQHEVR